MALSPILLVRADQYVQRRGIARGDTLGDGKDGAVWRTSRPSALKVHVAQQSYLYERDAYIRLREVDLRIAVGFVIPVLHDYDDELWALEMSIVTPPFAVDFASARLDFAPDLIEDEGHTLEDLVRDRFEDRAAEVLAFYHELVDRAGIYLTDLHLHNIKFAS
jgi:hypothetical protein